MSIETPIGVNSEHEEARIARENTKATLKKLREHLQQLEKDIRNDINARLSAFSEETGVGVTDLEVEIRSSYKIGIGHTTIANRVRATLDI